MKLKILDFKTLFFLLSIFYFLCSNFVLANVLNQSVIFSINPQYEYLGRSQVSATLRKISDKAYWYVSDDYWAGISKPQQDLFSQKLDELTQEFDGRIYPVETGFWGSESNPGVDNDSRVTVLIVRLIDLAGGYFDTTHLYKKSQAPESNEREIVFINTNSLTNERGKVFLAHEFQHLISFYQKDILRNATEDVWLNEARAEYAPRLLGYDDIFDSSNIRRRIFAFQQNSSDPLAEWKNESPDYGAITLFMYYLVDQYGDKILTDSLKSGKAGIESLNETLILNGFAEKFSDVFSNWTIANILSDGTINQRFAYKSQHLINFRISPTQSYSVSGVGTNISISNTVKDWQPAWYEFSTPVNSGSGLNLKIDFSADPGTKFRIPYIAFKINGQKDIGFIPFGSTSSPQASGTLFLKNFGSEIYKVILIPANHSKTSGFTENDPAAAFSFKVQLTTDFQEITSTPTPVSQLSTEALIQDLLEQIAGLQNQIGQLRQKTEIRSPSAVTNILTRDLLVGSRGDDVKWLQDFLIQEGVYPEARITGYFGALTKNAVIKFQQKYEIFPQIGYVGPKTRAKIKEITIE